MGSCSQPQIVCVTVTTSASGHRNRTEQVIVVWQMQQPRRQRCVRTQHQMPGGTTHVVTNVSNAVRKWCRAVRRVKCVVVCKYSTTNVCANGRLESQVICTNLQVPPAGRGSRLLGGVGHRTRATGGQVHETTIEVAEWCRRRCNVRTSHRNALRHATIRTNQQHREMQTSKGKQRLNRPAPAQRGTGNEWLTMNQNVHHKTVR